MDYEMVSAGDIVPSFIKNKLDKEIDVVDIVNKLFKEVYNDIEIKETFNKKDVYAYYSIDKTQKTIYGCADIVEVSTTSKKPLEYTEEYFNSDYSQRCILSLSRNLEEDEEITVTYHKSLSKIDTYDAMYPSLTHNIDKKVLKYIQEFFVETAKVCKDNINTSIILKKITELHNKIAQSRKK